MKLFSAHDHAFNMTERTVNGQSYTLSYDAENRMTGAASEDLFADSFESGSFSAWNSSVTDGGDLSVTTAAALEGSWGMQAVIDDNTAIYVTDQTPQELNGTQSPDRYERVYPVAPASSANGAFELELRDEASNANAQPFLVLRDATAPAVSDLSLGLGSAANAILEGHTLYFGPQSTGVLTVTVSAQDAIEGVKQVSFRLCLVPELLMIPTLLTSKTMPSRAAR